MTVVDIYTKRTCPFCVRAKALLAEKNVAFNEIKIDSDSDLRTKMIERSNGAYTVPQIFFNDNHVGGCDDLFALHTSGKLDELLK